MKRIDSARMKRNNTRLVFDLIREGESVSRKDLAEKTGLTSPSITNIANELIEQNYIVESGHEESNGGRKAALLSLNPNAGNIIGVSLTATAIYIVITDFKARLLDEMHIDMGDAPAQDAVIEKIVSSIKSIMDGQGVAKEQIHGIGLVTPGPIDVENGLIINPPNLTGWHDVPLKAIVGEQIGIPVEFEKETAASALCENWFGKAKASKVLVACGVYHTGIGASVVIDGKVFHGYGNSAGEIGHMVVDINGRQCACGNYGCLETVADGRSLLRRVKSKLKTDDAIRRECGIADVDALTLREILDRAESGEEAFRVELLTCARYVAIALSNLIVSVGPDTIVLTGDIPDYSPTFVDSVRQYIHGRPYPGHSQDIDIYSPALKRNTEAMGGVALVYRRIFKG
ncbi:MAG: ROK family transcriptional regulator [Clostridiales Family XIII bacterium]|jgi:predicted NBD/HSP70 family sugar kinase|nr:ROK family transcriptional regulator [Clostridiales Family XIII bacterium]